MQDLTNIFNALLKTNNNTVTSIQLVTFYVYPHPIYIKLIELLDNNLNIINATISTELDDKSIKNKIKDKIIINVSVYYIILHIYDTF